MKTISLFVIMLAMYTAIAQKYNLPYEQKNIDKNYVKVDSILYCNVFETTNVNYRDYLYDLKKSGKNDEYQIALPDTNGWRSKLAYNEPYVELYFRHPAYQNYPLVNVSYEQAEKYCDWLTLKYNSQPKRTYKKVRFRLPDKMEWEMAAHGGFKESIYPWEGPYLKNKDCMYMCNFNNIREEGITFDTLAKKYVIADYNQLGMPGLLNDHNDITGPVSSYFPNGFGIYNMAGNVSEMIKEKGIAKGGSWKSPGYDVRIASEELYTHSNNHMGFRVFMEILEN